MKPSLHVLQTKGGHPEELPGSACIDSRTAATTVTDSERQQRADTTHATPADYALPVDGRFVKVGWRRIASSGQLDLGAHPARLLLAA
jgi:hypothetical protein